MILTLRLESIAESHLGKDQFCLAQEMQLQHCVYCMKGTWNTTIKSILLR